MVAALAARERVQERAEAKGMPKRIPFGREVIPSS